MIPLFVTVCILFSVHAWGVELDHLKVSEQGPLTHVTSDLAGELAVIDGETGSVSRSFALDAQRGRDRVVQLEDSDEHLSRRLDIGSALLGLPYGMARMARIREVDGVVYATVLTWIAPYRFRNFFFSFHLSGEPLEDVALHAAVVLRLDADKAELLKVYQLEGRPLSASVQKVIYDFAEFELQSRSERSNACRETL